MWYAINIQCQCQLMPVTSKKYYLNRVIGPIRANSLYVYISFLLLLLSRPNDTAAHITPSAYLFSQKPRHTKNNNNNEKCVRNILSYMQYACACACVHDISIVYTMGTFHWNFMECHLKFRIHLYFVVVCKYCCAFVSIQKYVCVCVCTHMYTYEFLIKAKFACDVNIEEQHIKRI